MNARFTAGSCKRRLRGSGLAKRMFAQVAHQRHLVELDLGTARFGFFGAAALLLGGEFEGLEILKGRRQIVLRHHTFAFDFLQRRRADFRAAFRWSAGTTGKASRPISESLARWFSRATLSSRSVSLRSRSAFMRVERRHAALHFVDPEALQAQQRIGAFHRALPLPLES